MSTPHPQRTKRHVGPAEHPHTGTATKWVADDDTLLGYARECWEALPRRAVLLNMLPETLVGDYLRVRCLPLAGADLEQTASHWPREAVEGVPLSAFLLHHKVNWTEVAANLRRLLVPAT